MDLSDRDPIEVLACTGQTYTPTGDSDPVAVFLRARRVIGDNGLKVSGSPPPVPAADYEEPEDGVVNFRERTSVALGPGPVWRVGGAVCSCNRSARDRGQSSHVDRAEAP